MCSRVMNRVLPTCAVIAKCTAGAPSGGVAGGELHAATPAMTTATATTAVRMRVEHSPVPRVQRLLHLGDGPASRAHTQLAGAIATRRWLVANGVQFLRDRA